MPVATIYSSVLLSIYNTLHIFPITVFFPEYSVMTYTISVVTDFFFIYSKQNTKKLIKMCIKSIFFVYLPVVKTQLHIVYE